MRVNRTVQLMPWNGWSIHILRYEVHSCGRTPHGVRGLKYMLSARVPAVSGRTPHGVRGLKYADPGDGRCQGGSHPSRGAWIEMRARSARSGWRRSHPSRGAWIEISYNVRCYRDKPSRTPHGVRGLKYPTVNPRAMTKLSHPSRGAWIEMYSPMRRDTSRSVAPLTGCVD